MSNLLTRLRARRAETGDKGFTLVELLVVVVIIGILIAIAIPVYLNYQKGARDKSANSDVRNAVSTLELCNSDNNGYPTAIGSPTTTSGTTGGATYSTLTGCSGQSLKVSDGTTFTTYTSGTNPSSYIIVGANSKGSGTKAYCYNSTTGGSVQQVANSAITC